MSEFRKASLTSNLFGGALNHTEDHIWGTWCCGFLYFEKDIGVDVITSLVKDRLLNMKRFHSRYDAKTQGFFELPRDEADMSYHLKVVEANLPIEEIRTEYVGDVYKHFEFDADKPLWQFNYFPKIQDGRALLLTKIAHTIGDGISQIEILYRLLDKQDTEVYSAERPKGKKKKQRFGPLNRLMLRVQAPGKVIGNVLGSDDTFNPFSRADTSKAGKMKIAFGENVPLSKVKDIKEKLVGTTINDVLFGAINLAIDACLKDYEAEHGKGVRKSSSKIRFGVAINTRRGGEDVFKDGDPHNSVAQGLFKVVTTYKSRTDSIWQMKKKLDVMKASGLPVIQAAIGNFFMKTKSQQNAIKTFLKFYATSTAVVSNVPGPRKAVSLGGNEVCDFEFLLSSPKGCYIGLLSYNGQISVCICLEETTLLEPKQFTTNFTSEFNALYDEVMAEDANINDTTTGFFQTL